MKRCSKCGEEKELACFYKSNDRKDSVKNICKKCSSDKAKKYRLDNYEKVRERERRYRLNNPEKVKLAIKKWELANPEKVKERVKRRNPEKLRANEKRWRLANPEKDKERHKRYKLNNPEKVRIQNARYVKNLENCYVIASLHLPKGTQVPKELIELKRVTIQIKRQLKANK